jgi:hypothetical protein
MAGLVGDARGDVRVDQIVPTVEGGEPVCGGKIDARALFGLGDRAGRGDTARGGWANDMNGSSNA